MQFDQIWLWNDIYMPWMIDALEVAPLGQVWVTQMWWCACSDQMQRWLETLRVWANKRWSHLWGNGVLGVTLHRHFLGERATRHRVKDIDSGSQVKAKVDSFTEGTGRHLILSISQGLIGSGSWLCCTAFPHCLLMSHVSASAVSGFSGRP